MTSSCEVGGSDVDAAGFAATRWSVVLAAARGGPSAHAADAMGELCRTYWYPIYAFVRRRGHDTHEAEDLTQEFFAQLLAHEYLASVAAEKGKFRAFLLTALRRFLANQWDRAQAQKRGGGQVVVPLDSLVTCWLVNSSRHETTVLVLRGLRWCSCLQSSLVVK